MVFTGKYHLHKNTDNNVLACIRRVVSTAVYQLKRLPQQSLTMHHSTVHASLRTENLNLLNEQRFYQNNVRCQVTKRWKCCLTGLTQAHVLSYWPDTGVTQAHYRLAIHSFPGQLQMRALYSV